MNTSVIFYRPNLIGYVRLLLLLAGIFVEDTRFLYCYAVSVILDYFDGMAARAYNEESKLGACLDMITDRISTTLLCIKIAIKKPHYVRRCLLYIFFDVLSHFLFFVSMIYAGMHHKTFQHDALLRVYYNPTMLKVMCTGSELYFLGLYHTKKSNKILNYLAVVPLLKTFFHIVHLGRGIAVLSDVALNDVALNEVANKSD
ncbi:CDP-diacylglycerol--inositol 3-phosphatidyltransferase [Pancytospora philotis]|nr:CDP-diacylglycerol--inositol 3-phosphatidyltransferase [Pancytospora philotis]